MQLAINALKIGFIGDVLFLLASCQVEKLPVWYSTGGDWSKCETNQSMQKLQATYEGLGFGWIEINSASAQAGPAVQVPRSSNPCLKAGTIVTSDQTIIRFTASLVKPGTGF